MSDLISADKAKEIIDNGMEEAQKLINDPAKVNELVGSLETRLKDIPVAGTALANIPTMASMVRDFATQEYTAVAPKVIASYAGAFLYLIKRKDLIPDNIPLVGYLDDAAVIIAALKFTEPDLKAYREWKATRSTANTESTEKTVSTESTESKES
ncbi:MAG: DUF1232 domain-containing protein [Solobacterium sp.]|nr:DUF1232 domain-containing protein [Solobacterium sp.]